MCEADVGGSPLPEVAQQEASLSAALNTSTLTRVTYDFKREDMNYELEFVSGDRMPKEDYTTMVVAPTSKECRVRYKRRTAAA